MAGRRTRGWYAGGMKMTAAAMSIVDWMGVEEETHAGETGVATWRTRQFGEVRVRMVEYSAGYLADHWCAKGHVIHCLRGGLDIEIQDGTRHQLRAGQTYHVGDGEPGHRSRTDEGALLFIVD